MSFFMRILFPYIEPANPITNTNNTPPDNTLSLFDLFDPPDPAYWYHNSLSIFRLYYQSSSSSYLSKWLCLQQYTQIQNHTLPNSICSLLSSNFSTLQTFYPLSNLALMHKLLNMIIGYAIDTALQALQLNSIWVLT